MKIVYLAHRIPYPPDKGDKIRSFHQVQYLSERHEVWCACFVDEPADMQHVDALRAWCRDVAAIPLSRMRAGARAAVRLVCGGTLTEGFYGSAKMERVLAAWSQKVTFDAALFFSSSMAQYLRAVQARRTVLDFCDWDSLKWASYAKSSSGLRGWLYGLEACRLGRRERECLEQFDACTVVTEAEARALNGSALPTQLHVVRNGAELGPEVTAPAQDAPPRIGFVGEMSYRPNAEAVCWFSDNVLPRVRREVPGATFEIVGRAPSREVLSLGRREAISVIGAVDDVRSHLERFAVSVAPMLTGQGVQNKVLEAMAAARPVVLSSTAAAGIDAADGEHLLVADEASTVSDRVVQLLLNPSRRAELGAAARRRIARRYSWEGELAKLDALLSGVPAHSS